jgi:thiosulfate/3-mercaptopyruvate sulfurtransferase
MSVSPNTSIVSTQWLADRLGEPGLRVLDASWYLPSADRDARAEYDAGHVPGARFFDLDAASAPGPLPHMLPSEAEFAAYAGSLGVSDASQIIVYDGSGVNLSAPRAWYMFRVFGHDGVAVLDGGMVKWKREGRPLESGAPAPGSGAFHARLDRAGVRSMTEVEQALRANQVQVVDMRSRGRFRGSEPEPRPGVPSGHIPGALNLPYAELVGREGTLLPEAALRARLEQAGLTLDRPVIATCGSGVTACALLLALHRLGYQGALYDGAWSEWASRGGAIASGEG